MSFEVRSGVRQVCTLSPTLLNYILDWILGQALQDYPGAPVGAYVRMSDLAYDDDIVILSRSYIEMQGLLEAVTEASQTHLGRTHRNRRDWVTSETVALASQARQARL